MGKPSRIRASAAASVASFEISSPPATRRRRSKQKGTRSGTEADSESLRNGCTSTLVCRNPEEDRNYNSDQPNLAVQDPTQDQDHNHKRSFAHVFNQTSSLHDAIPVPLVASLAEGPILLFKPKDQPESRLAEPGTESQSHSSTSLHADNQLSQAIEAAQAASSVAVRLFNQATAIKHREKRIDEDLSVRESGPLGDHKGDFVQHLPSISGPPLLQSRKQGSVTNMSSRPGAGRRAGRDSGKDGDLETELLNRVLEAVRKAKEYNDESQRLGTEILALEEEIKVKGRSTPEQHRKLDDLYRKKMRNAEAEKKVHDEEDIVNNLAILATMRSTEEPAPRGGHVQKGRGKVSKASVESDVADSPGPSPSDTRVDILKRAKGTSQRSSSVASQNRSGTALKDDDTHKGLQAEKAGQFVVGTEVFYKFPKGSPDDLGVGIQCIIKKIWQEKKPVIYDVQDPEPDPSGKQNVHKATARDLIPIPASSASLPTFAVGTTVYARYPDTDTFYRAKVRAVQKGEYTLRFEGEEDDKEQPVEKRFVLDTRMR